ncbi:MAG TPA: heparinase II/III family protein [Azonexus sp.]
MHTSIQTTRAERLQRVTLSTIGQALLIGCLIVLGPLLSSPAGAQTSACVPNPQTDWMVSSDPLAQDIRPRDCAVVEQNPPDFSWPDISSTATYSLSLVYPDGRTRTLTANQNWRNWDEILPAGTYSWRVSYAGGGSSVTRKFVVGANAKPFLVPAASAVLGTVTAKAHPRSLPGSTALASIKSQRQTAISALLTEVNGRLSEALPSAGAGSTDAYNFSKMALASTQACVFTGQDSYCRDAVRRVMNLTAWDPRGATTYTRAGNDASARYLAWTVATGYDWLYSRFTSTQRTQIQGMLRVRVGDMYNDVIGSRSRVAKYPRDSQANRTLTAVAVISTMLAGDISEAGSTWLPNTLPLMVNLTNPWGTEEGGFANANAQSQWDVGDLLPMWYQLRNATGIDLAQKAWVRNWGRHFTYFTPPGMAGYSTVFGDGFEMNEREHQARYGKAYVYFAPTPLGRWHAGRLSGELQTRIEYLMAPPADFTTAPAFPAGTPNALALTSIGQVAMHSDLSNLARTSVYFKSSPPPYGAYNHSHADQNSFVVNSGGQRLAIESGYYDSYNSGHWKDWYRTTKAKNAITYDGGQGQLTYEQNGKMGSGKITQFSTSTAYDITSGDATAAYGGNLSKAVRSMVYLRPNLIVVYDNLASATSRQWEWNIHAMNQMTVTNDRQISIQNGTQKLCVTVLAGPSVRFSQNNQFSVAPSSGTQQWHGRFASTAKTATAEFVTLLNVGCTAVTASATKTDGVWKIPVGSQTVNINAAGTVSVGATVTEPAPTPTPTPEPEPTPTPTPEPTPTPTPSEPPQTLPSTNTRAVPTFESIGLYWKPPSNPGSAGCSVRYRKFGDSTWKTGLPLWYDSRNAECRGSLVHLTAGTSYAIQFSMPGQSPVAEVRTATWKEKFPIARTVSVPSGSQTLAITSGGTASGYVLYTPPAGTRSTLDGGNSQTYNVTISAPYVILRGFNLRGARQDAIRLLKGAHDVIIEDNDISGWGRLKGSSSEGNLGVNYDSAVHATCSDLSLERVIIQRNTIHDPRYTANSWSLGHPEGPQGITLESCGGNHVIRHNDIVGGTSGNYYNDAIGGCCNFTNVGFPNYDSDIYGNLIRNTWDDAIEAEGADRNVRIWGNYIDRTTLGVATTTVMTGPIYIFRNVYNRSKQLKAASPDQDTRNAFAKSGTQSAPGGRRYVFHNTLLQATQSGSTYPLGAGEGLAPAGLSITNTVTRNNILHTWKSTSAAIRGAGSGNDFGYDLYNGTLSGATETNGIRGTPTYQSGNGWTSEANGLYQLAPSSLGYDRGARVPNFNDSFVGAAPDIGAHEAGAPAMVFGVKAGAAAKAAAGL